MSGKGKYKRNPNRWPCVKRNIPDLDLGIEKPKRVRLKSQSIQRKTHKYPLKDKYLPHFDQHFFKFDDDYTTRKWYVSGYDVQYGLVIIKCDKRQRWSALKKPFEEALAKAKEDYKKTQRSTYSTAYQYLVSQKIQGLPPPPLDIDVEVLDPEHLYDTFYEE